MPKLPSEPPAAADDVHFAALVTAAEHFDRESPEVALIQCGITLAVEKGATQQEIEDFFRTAIDAVFQQP